MDGFATVLKELVSRPDLESGARVALHRDLADVQEKKLDDRRGAIAQLESVLVIDPGNIDALRGLQRLHRAAEEWSGSSPSSTASPASCPSPRRRSPCGARWPLLHEGKLEDRESAASAWRRIAEADPLNREAASALDRLYTELGKFEDLAFALELRRAQEGQSPQGREAPSGWPSSAARGSTTTAARCSSTRRSSPRTRDTPPPSTLLEAWARSHDPRQPQRAGDPRPGARPLRSSTRAAWPSARPASPTPSPTRRPASTAGDPRASTSGTWGSPSAPSSPRSRRSPQNVDRAGAKADLERLAREYRKLRGAGRHLREGRRRDAAAPTRTRCPGSGARPSCASSSARPRRRSGSGRRCWPRRRRTARRSTRWASSTRRARTRRASPRCTRARRSWRPGSRTSAARCCSRRARRARRPGTMPGPSTPTRRRWRSRRGTDGLEALDRLYATDASASRSRPTCWPSSPRSTTDARRRRLISCRGRSCSRREGAPGRGRGLRAAARSSPPGDSNAVAGLERLHRAARRPRRRPPGCWSPSTGASTTREAGGGAGGPARRRLAPDAARAARGDRHPARGAGPEVARLRRAAARLQRDARERRGPRRAGAAGRRDRLLRGAGRGLRGPAGARRSPSPCRRAVAPAGGALRRAPRPRSTSRSARWRRWPGASRRTWRCWTRWPASTAGPATPRSWRSVMRRQVVAETDAAQRRSTCCSSWRDLAEETLSDKALAAQCYRRDPRAQAGGRATRSSSSAGCSRRRERWPELAQLIDREIQLADARGAHEEAYELMVRLGRLKLTRLRRPARRAGPVPGGAPRRRRAPGRGGRARGDGALRQPAAGRGGRGPGAGVRRRWRPPKLVQMLESRASAEPVPQERAALLAQGRGDLRGPDGATPELAFVAATRALRELAGRRALARAVPHAGRRGGRPTTSWRAAGRGRPAGLRRRRPREPLPRAGAGSRQQARRGATRRVDAWKQVLELAPSDPEALEAIGQLYAGRRAAPPSCWRCCKPPARDHRGAARRAALLFQIGGLQEERSRTPRRAGHLPAPAGAQAGRRRRRWSGWTRSARSRSAGRSWRTCSAGALRCCPERATWSWSSAPAGGGARDASCSTSTARWSSTARCWPRSRTTRARWRSWRRWSQREPQNQPRSTCCCARTGRAASMAKLAAAHRDARRRVAGSLRAQDAAGASWPRLREAQDEPELGLPGALPRLQGGPERRRAARAGWSARPTRPDLRRARAAVRGGASRASPRRRTRRRCCLKLGGLSSSASTSPSGRSMFYETRPRAGRRPSRPRALPALDRLYGQLERVRPSWPACWRRWPQAHRARGEAWASSSAWASSPRSGSDSRTARRPRYERILEPGPEPPRRRRGCSSGIYERQRHARQAVQRARSIQRELVTGPERERVLGARWRRSPPRGWRTSRHSIELYRELLAEEPAQRAGLRRAGAGCWRRPAGSRSCATLLAGKTRADRRPARAGAPQRAAGPRALPARSGSRRRRCPFFKAALERDARHRNALETLRDIYEQLGQREELVAVLRRLIPLQEGAEGVKALAHPAGRGAGARWAAARRRWTPPAARWRSSRTRSAELDRVHKLFVALRAYGDAVRALELKAAGAG